MKETQRLVLVPMLDQQPCNYNSQAVGGYCNRNRRQSKYQPNMRARITQETVNDSDRRQRKKRSDAAASFRHLQLQVR